MLVLVRRRGPLFDAIIRALKNAGVPVAGADRLVLTEHIAIIDLMALADALLLPQDDLALAVALKSPLFGLRRRPAVRACLGPPRLRCAKRSPAAPGKARLRRRRRALTRCAERRGARRRSPSSPGCSVRKAGGGASSRGSASRRRTRSRNSSSSPSTTSAQEPPSLQGFLAWLRAADAVVKRDMEIDRDEVRVMTVHGAKGLEAPVVILADTTTPPAGPHGPRLLDVPQPRAAPDAPPCLVWAGPARRTMSRRSPTARARARQDAEDEHRRLLYVAMTRAAERLIVCGCQGVSHRPAGCWYDLVTNGLAGRPGFEADRRGRATRIGRYRLVPDAHRPAAGRAARDRDAAPDAGVARPHRRPPRPRRR